MRRLTLELLEERCAPFTLLGTAWPVMGGVVPLTFTVGSIGDGGLTGTLSPQQVHQAVVDALMSWAQYAPLQFTEVPSGGQLTFRRADISPIGQGYGPGSGLGGDVEVDDGRNWGDGSAGSLSLRNVLQHEVGHALGLGHETVQPAVMRPSVDSDPFDPALFPDDISGIRTLYGAGVGSVTTIQFPYTPAQSFAFDLAGQVTVRQGQGALPSTFVPFAGHTGDVALEYATSSLRATAPNGHVKEFDRDTNTELSSVVVPGSYPVAPSGAYPGYLGTVEAGRVGDLLVTEALGHVKAFDQSGVEVASFLTYEGYAGEVRLGAGDSRVYVMADNGHVKAFSVPDFTLVASFIQGGGSGSAPL